MCYAICVIAMLSLPRRIQGPKIDFEKLARVLCFCNATLPGEAGYQTLGSLRDRRLSLSTASRWSGVEEVEFKYVNNVF